MLSNVRGLTWFAVAVMFGCWVVTVAGQVTGNYTAWGWLLWYFLYTALTTYNFTKEYFTGRRY